MNKKYLFFKRLIDLFSALLVLLILSPIMIIISIAIKIDSPGPVLFKQERNGLNGKEFNILKFRSMNHRDKPETDAHNKSITRVGSFIRKTSLDELPQFINVLKGDMSFVGPRPWITNCWPYYTERQKLRFLVKPGLSGPAQLSGRKHLNILERIEYDIHYVENISLKYDLLIALKTVYVVLKPHDNIRTDYHIEWIVNTNLDSFFKVM